MSGFSFYHPLSGGDGNARSAHNEVVSADPLILGIDGGGSRSEARLRSGCETVAAASGGPLNPNHAGPARSAANLASLLAALGNAPSSSRPGASYADAACIGLSGVSHPASRTIVREAFQTAGFAVRGPRLLVGDVELVLEAAFGEAAPSGVVVICGTGSIALAREAGGGLVRAGGEGPELGDAGGGGWIGRRAVAAGIVAASATSGPPAALVPAVLAAVRAGDSAARAVLCDAARELAALARRAASSARLSDPFEVRMAGGVAVNSPELVELVARDLAAGTPEGRAGPLVREPVLGALALATRALGRGGDVPPGW